MSLSGKSLLIIGGSSGIGKSLAKMAMADGANVVIASRSNPDLAGSTFISLDVTQIGSTFKGYRKSFTE